MEELGEKTIRNYLHKSVINPTVVETETVSDGYRLLTDDLTIPYLQGKTADKVPVLLIEIQRLQFLNKMRAKNIEKINRIIDTAKQITVESIRASFY